MDRFHTRPTHSNRCRFSEEASLQPKRLVGSWDCFQQGDSLLPHSDLLPNLCVKRALGSRFRTCKQGILPKRFRLSRSRAISYNVQHQEPHATCDDSGHFDMLHEAQNRTYTFLRKWYLKSHGFVALRSRWRLRKTMDAKTQS